MDVIKMLFLSLLDYFAMIALMFALFRIRFKGMIPQTIFICIFLTYFSYTLHNVGVAGQAPVINAIVFVLCIWLVYRIHWFYSALIGVIGYLSYALILAGIYILLTYSGHMALEELRPDHIKFTILQIVSIIALLLLSVVMHRLRFGFTFVPSIENVKICWSRLHLNLLGLIVITLTVMSFWVDGLAKLDVFLFISITELLLLLMLLYYARKKELSY